MKIVDQIKEDFKDFPDLVFKDIKIERKTIYFAYLESIADNKQLDNFLIRNITSSSNKIKNISQIFPASKLIEIQKHEIETYLCNGFTIIFNKNIYAFETKAALNRSISEANTEAALFAPKDSFVENYQQNIGLIRRRIKSKHLKIIENKIGQYTNTNTGILYIDNIAKDELIQHCLLKIKDLDIESILDSGDFKQYLIEENKNAFPTVKLTERPDTATKALLAGKIVIIVDTSPFAIIIPAVLADHINPVVDDYSTGININFVKMLRLFCFCITIIMPAIYIAITNFNPESIPTGLMKTIASQRFNMPFPAFVEIILLLLAVEILRESDLRFPNAYGGAVSVFSGMLLGEAAISAGFTSPIMIIVIAITFISSLIFNDVSFNGAIRIWRYTFVLFAASFGLYGIYACLIIMLVNLCSYNSFGLPYMLPFAPIDIPYLKETLFKSSTKNDTLRSKYLTDKNFRKKG